MNSNRNVTNELLFLELVGKLKHIKRTGWVKKDIADCETISGHMYRMAMTTFLLNDSYGLNRLRCMELALVHDLAECIVGDITPYCGVSREEKKKREDAAMQDIAKLTGLAADYLLELFNEYEEQNTNEAKLVKDLDMFDMIQQAFEYEKLKNSPRKLQEFFDSTEGKFKHPFVISLVEEVYNQRKAFQQGCK